MKVIKKSLIIALLILINVAEYLYKSIKMLYVKNKKKIKNVHTMLKEELNK